MRLLTPGDPVACSRPISSRCFWGEQSTRLALLLLRAGAATVCGGGMLFSLSAAVALDWLPCLRMSSERIASPGDCIAGSTTLMEAAVLSMCACGECAGLCCCAVGGEWNAVSDLNCGRGAKRVGDDGEWESRSNRSLRWRHTQAESVSRPV